MFRLRDVLTLGAGEQVRLLTRTHPLMLGVRLAVCGVLIVASMTILFANGQTAAAFFISLLVLVVSVFKAAGFLLAWDGTVLVVTDRRVVAALRRGFLKHKQAEWPRPLAEGVELVRPKGVWKWVGLRGFHFHANDTAKDVLFPPIVKPSRVKSLLSPERAQA